MAEILDVGGTTTNKDGVVGRINPDEARARAESLRQSAEHLKDILNAVNEQMNRIGDSENDQAVSYSSKSDKEIRLEFERLYGEFPRFYNAIIKNADDIRDIANGMEEE